MTPETKDTKSKERFSLVEVPTQVGLFIKDEKEDTVLDDKKALLEILNSVSKIKEALIK